MPIKTEVVPVEEKELEKKEKVPKAQAKRRTKAPPEAPEAPEAEAPPVEVPEVLPEAPKKPKSKAKSKAAPKKKKEDLSQKADCTICNSETTHEDLLLKHKCSKSALNEKGSPSKRHRLHHRLSGRTRIGSRRTRTFRSPTKNRNRCSSPLLQPSWGTP